MDISISERLDKLRLACEEKCLKIAQTNEELSMIQNECAHIAEQMPRQSILKALQQELAEANMNLGI